MNPWKAHYQDKNHDLYVNIFNQFDADHVLSSLTMTIDGITFCGMSFCDWEIADKADLEIASKRFSIFTWGAEETQFTHMLQRYSLELELPTEVVDMNNQTLPAVIQIAMQQKENTNHQPCSKYMLQDKLVFPDIIECTCFQLVIQSNIFSADNPSMDFEISLQQICKKLKTHYFLKCCFGCLYSDYSPYGNDYFATMLCYLSVAEKYIQVLGKYHEPEGTRSIWDVYSAGIQVQETGLCPAFQPRINCLGGYRGLLYL